VDEITPDKTLTIVALGAHPDPFDMPYQAGGTLAKYAKRGHRVVTVSAAFEDEWADEVRAIAARLGASQEWLDFEEGAIFDDPTHTHRIMDLLRRHKADVVITHQPTDYHPDHRALSRAVLAACLLARVEEIESEHEPHKIGNLWYSETTSGLASEGSIYVDVSETVDQKVEALRLHAGLSERRGVSHLDSIEHLIEREITTMKFRGLQVERDHCETFLPAVGYRITWAHDLLPIATLPPIET
jgi:LmbE family N-acetylglucosaminyl deacetylase